MSAEVIALLLRGAFIAIAALRRSGMTADEINARFDLVDQGGDPISADDVRSMGDAWQEQIDAGRKIT